MKGFLEVARAMLEGLAIGAAIAAGIAAPVAVLWWLLF